MGVIRKINETELVNGQSSQDIYPVTSTLAVYNTNNEQLDTILSSINITSGTGDNSIIQKEESSLNTATGDNSIALGVGSSATNSCAIAIGEGTESKNSSEVSLGKYNKSIDSGSTTYKTAFTVGFGTASTRKNAIEVKQNGDVYIKGVGGFSGSNAGNNGIMPASRAIVTPINVTATEVENDVPVLDTTISSGQIETKAVNCIYLATVDDADDKYVYFLSRIIGNFDEEGLQFEFQWSGFGYGVSGFHTRILTLETDEETGYLTITRYRGLREGGTVMFDYPAAEG